MSGTDILDITSKEETLLNELSETLRKEAECIAASYLEAAPGQATSYHIDPGILHITYTQKGSGKCVIGETEYPLKPGTINIIYPYAPHAFTPDNKTPYINWNLKVHFNCHLPQGFPPLLKISGSKKRKFERIFTKLHKSFHSPHCLVKNLEETALLLQLFSVLLEQIKGRMEQTAMNNAENTFALSIHQLQSPPFIFPGLDFLASHCGMSRRKYTDFFRTATGLSPREFWMKSKMSYALLLLKRRKFSVKETAVQCGFSNSQNFIRAFRKHFGTSPTKAQTAISGN